VDDEAEREDEKLKKKTSNGWFSFGNRKSKKKENKIEKNNDPTAENKTKDKNPKKEKPVKDKELKEEKPVKDKELKEKKSKGDKKSRRKI
jgi:hypothetical protein